MSGIQSPLLKRTVIECNLGEPIFLHFMSLQSLRVSRNATNAATVVWEY